MTLPLRHAGDPARIASCSRKLKYTTEDKARAAGRRSLNVHADGATRLWVYACARCRRWHLTSMRMSSVAVTAIELREGVPE